MEEGTPEETPEPTGPLHAARAWVTESPTHVGYVVVAAVLLLTWPFGGWAPAAEPEATSEVGEEVSAAPFTVTVERAVAGPALGYPFGAFNPEINPDQADDQDVLLFVTVRNDSDETLPLRELFADTLEVHGLEEPVTTTGAPQDEVSAWSAVYDVGGGTPQLVGALGPGLEHELVLQQPVSGEAPEELEVRVFSRTHRLSSVEDTMIWADPAPASTVTVPVERPEEPLFRAPWEDGR